MKHEKPMQYYGMTYALMEWKQFAGHLVVFVLVHIGFFIGIGFSESVQQTHITGLFGMWFDNDVSGIPFNHEGVNKFSQVWLLVLLIDFVITFSYTIFPKKKPAV